MSECGPGIDVKINSKIREFQPRLIEKLIIDYKFRVERFVWVIEWFYGSLPKGL